VESNATDRQAFEELIHSERLEYDYQFASSVGEARKLIESTPFDVVITAFQLSTGRHGPPGSKMRPRWSSYRIYTC